MGDVTLFDCMLLDGLNDAFSGQHSGWHTGTVVFDAPALASTTAMRAGLIWIASCSGQCF